ncbi:MAG: aminotransferase class V-fold PLP-dependent enzyme, partial [Clostridia bacterium]|nr:aminotransferase class V-fold PLP-dependent enzyme [Clostridia bacterium]
MIYLDNAATTHKKPLSVILNTLKAMTIDSVNAGRGGYKLSIRAENEILDTRENFKQCFNLKSIDNVIFTSGATMSINLGLFGTKKLDGHIVATIYEHNSVLRCLEYLKANYNITYTLVAPRADGVINPSDIESAINNKTYLIV